MTLSSACFQQSRHRLHDETLWSLKFGLLRQLPGGNNEFYSKKKENHSIIQHHFAHNDKNRQCEVKQGKVASRKTCRLFTRSSLLRRQQSLLIVNPVTRLICFKICCQSPEFDFPHWARVPSPQLSSCQL